MNDVLKKYVAYDPDTFEFEGFFSEGRKELPETLDEVNSETFLEDKGQNTHYNPDTKVFYTPEADLLAKEEEQLRGWRDYHLSATDKYMMSDFRITGQERVELLKFRDELRDYPDTRVRPVVPGFFKG